MAHAQGAKGSASAAEAHPLEIEANGINVISDSERKGSNSTFRRYPRQTQEWNGPERSWRQRQTFACAGRGNIRFY